MNSDNPGKNHKESIRGLNLGPTLVQTLILLVACILIGAKLSPSSFPPGTVIELPLEQFSYVPTRYGYQFNYTLPDGTFRDEIAKVLNGTSTARDLEYANMLAMNQRPAREQGLKVRKLSGKSLSTLAG